MGAGNSTSAYNGSCDICGNSDPYTTKISIANPYWGQMLCRNHLYDAPKCVSCQRYQATYGVVSFEDGRKLCASCHCAAIMDESGCQSLATTIYKFYKHKLGLRFKSKVSVLLVDGKEIAKLRRQADDDIQGLTIKYSTNINSITHCSEKYGDIEAMKDAAYREKPTIVILYGLHRLEAGKVIAHELMHAWIHEQDWESKPLDQKVEEGLCNLVAHIWLNSSASNTDNWLDDGIRRHSLNALETNPDYIYGDGFREAKQAYDYYNDLRKTLSYIEAHGTFS